MFVAGAGECQAQIVVGLEALDVAIMNSGDWKRWGPAPAVAMMAMGRS